MRSAPRTTIWLAAECLLLFGGLPFALWLFRMQAALFAVLWLVAIGCWLALRKHGSESPQAPLEPEEHSWHALKPLMLRFALSAAGLTVLLALVDPKRLLEFPREQPSLWAAVMVFYPLFSVLPQELIYRAFFFRRYAPLFRTPFLMICANALAFGHAHLLFNNAVAYVLSILGGWIFAQSYHQTRSLKRVCLEHALYGCFIFTVGLGHYFHAGSVARY
ncbi:CPBP family intramembrane glutamic endopeptidase [Hyalangium versicolor]|uniref:CPBP family intramembrane glutamic endopeptidase n=1 Tax=Hyalangium versicolor TaxID=2861190 RepID=UPI001CC976D7|nr:CPBP family intramembrane glutamic endopeptidase [Hyalangium versicolor]